MRPDWRDRAACAGAALHGLTFFPVGLEGGGSTSETHRQKVDALSYCAVCTVRTPCLDYAMAHRIEHGIWGGKTSWERVKIARARRHGRTA